MYEEEITTKMPDNMYQHLSQKSELSHVDWVIKGRVDGKDEGPPILEQPTMVQKNKVNKNSGYGIITSHMSRCMNNQQHDMMVCEAEAGVLKFIYNVYVSDKYDLAIVESLSKFPLKFGPMKNHHDILMTSGKDSQ